ncbi:hypothetical protein M8542_49435 [Amycolatopsis sp. OK19-0408]|uniref:Uncharacterized protein n=1 Tax=Amycolatopsis iheyensis TaxID=2945988 RepID=A0A9X2NPK6_9PSEU|nr:hypothetical protein [Amycolatopsis iheyensis]MCR6490834.1 hypothetical protein [Amycolatopsis iheyensis]
MIETTVARINYRECLTPVRALTGRRTSPRQRQPILSILVHTVDERRNGAAALLAAHR